MTRIPVSSVMPARPDISDETRVAMRAKFAERDKSQAAYAHQPDEWVAYQVSMLRRTDIDFACIQEAARDRIMHLSLQIDDYQILCGALRAQLDAHIDAAIERGEA